MLDCSQRTRYEHADELIDKYWAHYKLQSFSAEKKGVEGLAFVPFLSLSSTHTRHSVYCFTLQSPTDGDAMGNRTALRGKRERKCLSSIINRQLVWHLSLHCISLWSIYLPSYLWQTTALQHNRTTCWDKNFLISQFTKEMLLGCPLRCVELWCGRDVWSLKIEMNMLLSLHTQLHEGLKHLRDVRDKVGQYFSQ